MLGWTPSQVAPPPSQNIAASTVQDWCKHMLCRHSREENSKTKNKKKLENKSMQCKYPPSCQKNVSQWSLHCLFNALQGRRCCSLSLSLSKLLLPLFCGVCSAVWCSLGRLVSPTHSPSAKQQCTLPCFFFFTCWSLLLFPILASVAYSSSPIKTRIVFLFENNPVVKNAT